MSEAVGLVSPNTHPRLSFLLADVTSQRNPACLLMKRQYMYVLLNAASFYQSCKPALSADALSLHPDSMSVCGLVSAVTDLDKVFENPAGFRARRGF